MSTIRVVNLQHTDATEPNIVLQSDGTSVFASGITISGGTNLTVSGTAEFASGTVSAPGITFIDDNNTGIYEPAADTVAITTAAAERLRVDSSGRLGIGTTSPESYNVNGDNLVIQNSDGTGSAGMTIRAGTGAQSTIYFADGTSTSAAIRGYIQYAHNGDFLRLGTDANERLRIDSSGRVLIGTSSAATAGTLFLQGISGNTSAGAYIHLQRGNIPTGSGSPIGNIFFADNSSNLGASITSASEGAWNSGSSHPSRLVFSTTPSGSSSPTERIRVDSSGNVGIADTGPNFKIDVNGDVGIREGNNLVWHDGSGTTAFRLRAESNNKLFFERASGNEAQMIIDDGNVGIGTSSPAQLLDLASTAPNIRLTDTVDGHSEIDGNAASLKFNADKGNAKADSTISFAVDNTERMRIDSSGRLLIGTSSSIDVGSSASAKLQVTHAANSLSAALYSTVDAVGPAGVIALGHGRGSVTGLLSDDDVMGQIRFAGADGTDLETVGAQISAEVDGTPGANDMPGRLVFSTTADGSSSVTERMRITSDGVMQMGDASTSGNGGWSVWISDPTTAHARGRMIFYAKSGTGAVQEIIQVFNGSSGQFLVRADGNVQNANNSYGALSDSKLKENIIDASSQWNDIKNLRVRKYNLIDGQTHTQIGVVAQEVETVSPGLVSESPDRDEEGNDLGTTTKSVNYSVLYMKAVKALQEAMDRIETLEAQNINLVERIEALESK